MKIIVSNTVTLNGGDAAILMALDQTLRLAFGDDIELVVYDSQAPIADRYYDYTFQTLFWERIKGPLAKWRRNRALKTLEDGGTVRALQKDFDEYKDADLIVSTGGTYLVEHYNLGHRWMDFEAAKVSGTPFFFFTQSLGPFQDPENIRRVKHAFGDSELVLLRDDKSKGHLTDHGIDPQNLHVQADCVFILADPAKLEQAKKRTISEPKRAAISVRGWTHFGERSAEDGMAAYRRSIGACAEHLVDQGFDITFVSTCQGIREYWTNDAEVAHEIYAELREDVKSRVEVDASFNLPTSLQDAFAGYDLVIATRMHAAILALTAGTPVFPIAYEFKTKELFERLGVPQFTQDIETITPDSAVASLQEFLDTVDDWRGDLMDGVAAEYESAKMSADLMRDTYKRVTAQQKT